MLYTENASSFQLTTSQKQYNFSAGPGILPQEVMEQAAQAALDYEGLGLSLLEMSHRSQPVVELMAEAEQLVAELLGLNDEYKVLFLTGGASSQFYMVPMNLLNAEETACYVDTGSWSTKAIKEAKNFGNVAVLGSSKESNFNYIPKGYTIPEDAKYLHITSNNTIYGTQYHSFPKSDAMLVADMSSDIFSRVFDAQQFDLIYAGAQKNLGPAGTTLLIVRKSILGKVERSIPTMLDYQTHVKKNSAFNTPPVYPIYVCLLTLRWLKKNGGVTAMEKINRDKAQLLYNAIDTSEYFEGTAAKEDRSIMNVPFVMKEDQYTKKFMEYCAKHKVSGIKGHRSVGGFRASIYNAMPKTGVEYLVDLMNNFKL
ncbi:MAG: 3-phosphoserine/phosphohydroxythreonine transaminase [Saprospiraceae bacterium]|nr:3-phosphoserine/phosphohydroxythreonine transaminase [Saprospiraceae bacterium]